MWQRKYFKTRENKNTFVEKNKGKFQMVEVFVNNQYCIEYRKLVVIDIG